jgi:hypothetical protein
MMSSLIEMLAGQLDEGTIRQISGQLGADEGTTQQAISAALPMLLGAMERNAASPDGAQALDNALARGHDGSILNDIPAALSQQSTLLDGAAILGHVLGGRQRNVETGISKATGLNQNSTAQLLMMLAPLVLGALGKQKQQQGLGSGDLAEVLGQERQSSESSLGGLAQILDMDSDGDVTDEIISIGSKLLRNFFSQR